MANLLELMRMAKGNGAAPAAPAARLAHEPFVFWSGIDYPGEFHALMERRVPFGIATVPSGPGRKGMSLDDFEQLLRLLRSTRDSRSSAPIFVDSGAYRETSGTTYTEADWDQVLDRYQRVAEAAGPGASGAPPRVFVVAPDVVGSFSGTEARLAGRGPQLKALVALGAHILLPIQPGPGTLQEREARLRTAAGVGPAGSSSSRDLQGREAVHPAGEGGVGGLGGASGQGSGKAASGNGGVGGAGGRGGHGGLGGDGGNAGDRTFTLEQCWDASLARVYSRDVDDGEVGSIDACLVAAPAVDG